MHGNPILLSHHACSTEIAAQRAHGEVRHEETWRFSESKRSPAAGEPVLAENPAFSSLRRPLITTPSRGQAVHYRDACNRATCVDGVWNVLLVFLSVLDAWIDMPPNYDTAKHEPRGLDTGVGGSGFIPLEPPRGFLVNDGHGDAITKHGYCIYHRDRSRAVAES